MDMKIKKQEASFACCSLKMEERAHSCVSCVESLAWFFLGELWRNAWWSGATATETNWVLGPVL